LQFLFSDHARTPWTYVETDLATLHETIGSWAGQRRLRLNLRVHVHEEAMPNGGPADADAIAMLPRLELDEVSAERLRVDGYDSCPICLDVYEVGETVVCMPCSGNHLSHADCLEKWLGTASTCPSCRYMLPSKGSSPSAQELHELCAAARVVLGRIQRDEPPPCSSCDDDDDDDEPSPTSIAADVSSEPRQPEMPGASAGSVSPGRTQTTIQHLSTPVALARGSSDLIETPSRSRSRFSFTRTPSTRGASRTRPTPSVNRLLGMGRCLFARHQN